jgi:hypothetical protein
MPSETAEAPRNPRSDTGKIVWTNRDIYAISWIAHQYTIHLHHLQQLLAQQPGYGAQSTERLSEAATRDVVSRWKRAGWVKTEFVRAHEPFWIWPTRQALRKLSLPYAYKDIGQTCLADLSHLAAINEIRLEHADGDEDIQWISERQLLQQVTREAGQEILHRPDGVMHWKGKGIIAIEAELSSKRVSELRDNLMELIRGEAYLSLKAEHGEEQAAKQSQGKRSQFTEIWYFGPEHVRKQVRRECAKLVDKEYVSSEEAERIFTLWYPLAQTKEEKQREAEEDGENLEEIDLED